MGVGATFLTSKEFNKLDLIQVLKESFEKTSNLDKKILEQILKETILV